LNISTLTAAWNTLTIDYDVVVIAVVVTTAAAAFDAYYYDLNNGEVQLGGRAHCVSP
jgi:hypothetical protein